MANKRCTAADKWEELPDFDVPDEELRAFLAHADQCPYHRKLLRDLAGSVGGVLNNVYAKNIQTAGTVSGEQVQGGVHNLIKGDVGNLIEGEVNTLNTGPVQYHHDTHVHPPADDAFVEVSFDKSSKERLVSKAKMLGMHERVVTYLTQELTSRPDPTERYWVYIALGEIGGGEARTALLKGLEEDNAYARLGAEKGWEILTADG